MLGIWFLLTLTIAIASATPLEFENRGIGIAFVGAVKILTDFRGV